MTSLERKVAVLLAKDCTSCRGDYYEDHASDARVIVALVLEDAVNAAIHAKALFERDSGCGSAALKAIRALGSKWKP